MREDVDEQGNTSFNQIDVENYGSQIESTDLKDAVDWLKGLQEEGIEDADSLVEDEITDTTDATDTSDATDTADTTGEKHSIPEQSQLKPIPAGTQNTDPSTKTDTEPIGNVFRRHIKTDPRKKALARHKLWLEDLQHEYPMPYHPYKIGVYIRYYNQTQHKKYYEKHIQQFMDAINCCKKWTLVDFYIDKGPTAPRMENAKEWCRLLGDCFTGKVDLIVTQKKSNVSSDADELATVVRLLAAQKHPAGIYFVSEDIFTLASYYRSDLRDTDMFPQDFEPLPEDELDVPMIYEGEKVKQLDLFDDLSANDEDDLSDEVADECEDDLSDEVTDEDVDEDIEGGSDYDRLD